MHRAFARAQSSPGSLQSPDYFRSPLSISGNAKKSLHIPVLKLTVHLGELDGDEGLWHWVLVVPAVPQVRMFPPLICSSSEASSSSSSDAAAAEASGSSEIWRWETSDDAVGAYAALLGTLALGSWWSAPSFAYADLPYFLSLAYCTVYIGAHRWVGMRGVSAAVPAAAVRELSLTTARKLARTAPAHAAPSTQRSST